MRNNPLFAINQEKRTHMFCIKKLPFYDQSGKTYQQSGILW
jgi:hypothetical protein